jgi:hypothetical protein
VRIFDVHDLSNKDPKFKFIRTSNAPLGAGWGNELSHIVTVMQGYPDLILTEYAAQPKKTPTAPTTFEPTWSNKEVGMLAMHPPTANLWIYS